MCMSEGCSRHLLVVFFVECSLEEFFQTLDDTNLFPILPVLITMAHS